MNEDFDYPHEKFSLAIYTLSTGKGSIQERVASAYRDSLMLLEANELPDVIQENFRAIQQRLIRIRDIEGSDGDIQVTADFMDDETAVEIARQIVEMFHTITEAYYGVDD